MVYFTIIIPFFSFCLAALPRQSLPALHQADLLSTVAASSDSSSMRVVVNELLLKLERSNPTAAPATSPLLNGEWSLAYQGGYAEGLVSSPTRQLALFAYAGGYAPTMFGMALARLLPDSLLTAQSKVP